MLQTACTPKTGFERGVARAARARILVVEDSEAQRREAVKLPIAGRAHPPQQEG
jgi:hypothetical protein